MLSFSEWERCVEVQGPIKESQRSSTDLCVWRSTGTSSPARKLVLKRIRVKKTDLEEMRLLLPRLQRIRRESHLNVLPIHGHLFVDCKLDILSEYLPGGSLAQRLQRQIEVLGGEHFSEEQVLKWLLEMSNGLSYLHAKNIVHGNLKCENVLFSGQDTVKLVDFGIKTELNPGDPDFYAYSPEQQAQGPASVKSDVYMLGTCVYKCVTLRSMRKEIDPEVVLGKKFVSSANLILTRPAGHADAARVGQRTRSAVDFKLKLFANDYSTALKENLMCKNL